MNNGFPHLAKEEYFGLDINEQNIGPTNIYHIETCSLISLTVYKDQAELSRTIRPQLKVGKISMIVFKKLSPAVDKDSFRVDVTGPGVIRDVFYRSVPLPDTERTTQEKRQELQSDITACNKTVKLLYSKQNRLKTQKMVIDGFSETLVEKRDEDFKSKTSMFDPKHMETLSSFLKLYEDQVEKIDLDLMQTQDRIDETLHRLDEQQKLLDNLETNNHEKLSRELTVMLECRENEPVVLNISYILTSCQWTPSYDIRVYSNDGNMKILYYGQIQQNTGEDWSPDSMFLSTAQPGIGEQAPPLNGQSIRYRDVRRRPQKMSKSKRMTKALSFHSAKEDKQLMQTSIYSNTTNSTINTNRNIVGQQAHPSVIDEMLCLSDDTLAGPSNFREDYMLMKSPSRELSATPMHSNLVNGGGMATISGAHNGYLNSAPEDTLSPQKMGVTSSKHQQLSPHSNSSNSNAPVVHFTVPRPPTISQNIDYNSGNSLATTVTTALDSREAMFQRALVGVIDLHPTFEYVAVPRRTPYAYLKAICHNGSSYPILPGSANVFIDNNFIGKTTLSTVAPQEEFKCCLGVDHGVKINYKPIFKYREYPGSTTSGSGGGTGGGGIISGGSSSGGASVSSRGNCIVVFKQLIEIKNNHQRNIRLLVKDQLPVSGEDKIKVHLLEPQINSKHNREKSIRLTKTNVIEWNLEMHPNELKELTLKYQVEHPASEEIDVAFLNIDI